MRHSVPEDFGYSAETEYLDEPPGLVLEGFAEIMVIHSALEDPSFRPTADMKIEKEMALEMLYAAEANIDPEWINRDDLMVSIPINYENVIFTALSNQLLDDRITKRATQIKKDFLEKNRRRYVDHS